MENLDLDVIKHLQNLKPEIVLHEIEGRTYETYKNVDDISLSAIMAPLKETIVIASLQGFMDYCLDVMKDTTGLAIKFNSYRNVSLIVKEHDKWGRQQVLATCDASSYTARIDNIEDLYSDEFILQLLTKFKATPMRDTLLAVASSVKKTNESKAEDDGVTQSTTVGSGVKTKVEVKNPVVLKPCITFPELDQPEVPFVFRISNRREEPLLNLFTGHDGKWKIEALNKAVTFLKSSIELPFYY